ncbi:hypothetical protein EDD21DRAFT_369114 [Dissophora ornata]|nr:hypothetical protein EDD21DRAFT_369114 [Dissophora ornata]
MAGGSLSNSNSATSIDSSAANGRSTASNPTLVLEPVNNGFATKSLDLPENTHVKIGRQTGVTTAPSAANGYFDSKVLSRIHAEVWSENSKVFIKDLKSSNGTFLNGKRLSPENVESEPFELNQNDHLEFGIDIMDDSGSMLHEKVACKVYYFTMSYPTPGGSPQEAHARLKSSSPTEPGSNSRPASVTGQGTNIDLIISRLQSELTRSQETNADLGALKQGLGELERTITVSAKEEGKQSGSKGSDAVVQATQAVEYQRLLVENNQAYATEIARLTRMLEDTQAEMNAYVQKIQLLEPLVADDEILRRDIAQNSAELTKVKLERDLAKDSMNELITEHQQVMESLRKEQETALAVLEVTHKESLECVARETALAQELLMSKHQEDLEKAIQSIAVPEVDSANAEEAASLQLDVSSLQLDVSSLQLNVSSLTTEVGILQQTVEKQIEEIKELSSEKVVLTRELSETKAVVVKAEKELKEAKQRTTQENIVALTPTSPTIKAEGVICKECLGRAATTTTATSVTSTRDSKDTVARYEFSWAQFVFPMSKKGQPLPFHQVRLFFKKKNAVYL